MYKAVIIDDEPDCVEVIHLILQQYYPTMIQPYLFTEPLEVIDNIAQINPDILFLDINMPHIDGFQLLEKLMPFTFKVIFTTAYDNYAIKALRFGAIDYLLKPISINDLNASIAKFLISTKDLGYSESIIKEPKIAIGNSDGIIFQKLMEILYCQSFDNYTIFNIEGGKKIVASKTLKEYEMILSDYGFCRVHNSYLVNLSRIDKYIKSDGGYLEIGEDKVPVSRSKKMEIAKLLDEISL